MAELRYEKDRESIWFYTQTHGLLKTSSINYTGDRVLYYDGSTISADYECNYNIVNNTLNFITTLDNGYLLLSDDAKAFMERSRGSGTLGIIKDKIGKIYGLLTGKNANVIRLNDYSIILMAFQRNDNGTVRVGSFFVNGRYGFIQNGKLYMQYYYYTTTYNIPTLSQAIVDKNVEWRLNWWWNDSNLRPILVIKGLEYGEALPDANSYAVTAIGYNRTGNIPNSSSSDYITYCDIPFANNQLTNFNTGSYISNIFGYGSGWFDRGVAWLYGLDAHSITSSAHSFLDTFYADSIYRDGDVIKPEEKADGAGGWTSNRGGGGGIIETLTDIEDLTQDIIEKPSLPPASVQAGASDLFTLFKINLNMLNQLNNLIFREPNLWNGFIGFFTATNSNPLDYITSLKVYPFMPETVSTKSMTIAYIDAETININNAPYVNQYHDFDCGTVHIPLFWGNCLDYMNTHITLYLPYIGNVILPTQFVIDKDVNISYRIDLITGQCIAFVTVNDNFIIAQHIGTMGSEIPLSARSSSGMAQRMVQGVFDGANALTQAYSGNMAGSLSSLVQSARNVNSAFIPNAPTSKGSFNGNIGMIGIQYPYMIIERANQCLPSLYSNMQGYPSEIYMKLGDCNGFTKVEKTQLKNVKCTEQEKKEIEQFLLEGVYI